MSDLSSQTPAAEGNLNSRTGSAVEVKYAANRLYFQPDTGEIIVLSVEDAGELEAHAFEMAKAVDDLHAANIKVSKAVDHYSEVKGSNDPALISFAKSQYDKAQHLLAEARRILTTNLKDVDVLAKHGTNASGIVELIPLQSASGAPGRTRQYNRKVVHVKGAKLRNLGLRRFPLDRERRPRSAARNVVGSQQADPNGSESFITRNTSGVSVDRAKLLKQIKDIKPEIKAELLSFDDHSCDGIISDWAEAFNKKLTHQEEGIFGIGEKNIDFSAGAQLMRYAAGVGAEASWDPKNGKAGMKAECKAEFSLAEAKASLKFMAPHRLGWVLQFTSPTSNETYPLGAIRATLEIVAAGVVGASVLIEASAEIESDNLKVKVRGVTTAAPPPSIDPSAGPNVLPPPKTVTPVKAEIGAFAGLKADIDLNGSLQWLDPTSTKEKPDFEDFFKIAPGVSGMLGAGAGAKLEINYRNGKIYWHHSGQPVFGCRRARKNRMRDECCTRDQIHRVVFLPAVPRQF